MFKLFSSHDIERRDQYSTHYTQMYFHSAAHLNIYFAERPHRLDLIPNIQTIMKRDSVRCCKYHQETMHDLKGVIGFL